MVSTILEPLLGACAVLAWLTMLVSWILMVRHRAPHVSLGSLLFSGFKSLDPSNFTERGQKIQRWFFAGFAGFFICVLALMLAPSLAGS